MTTSLTHALISLLKQQEIGVIMVKTISQRFCEIHEPQSSSMVTCVDFLLAVMFSFIGTAVSVFLTAAVSIFVLWVTFTKIPMLANMTREIVTILFN